MHILDTNHCVFLMNGLSKVAKGLTPQSQNTVAKYLALSEPIHVCKITIAELYYGAFKSDPARIAENLNRLEIFKNSVNVLPLENGILKLFAQKRVILEKAGNGMQDFDLLIGCTAIFHQATLATNDAVFARLTPELIVDDWSVSPTP